MAIGTYFAPGSVKDLKSAYVGAGGVKQVGSIWVGQGGSPKLVWPPYIYDNGVYSPLGGGINFFDYASTTSPRVLEQSTYIQIISTSGWSTATTSLRGCYCKEAIDFSLYKTLSMTFTIPTPITSSSSTSEHLYLGACTGAPSLSNGGVLSTSGTVYEAERIMSSSDSSTATYTMSVDLSSVSGNLYVYIGYKDTRSNGPAAIEIRISRIEVSA